MIFLSHTLRDDTIGYGGKPGFTAEQVRDIDCGDTANTMSFSLSNHIGTHIDAPKHFFADAPGVDDYDADWWTFRHVCVADVDGVGSGDLVEPRHLEGADLRPETDLVLIRTGWEAVRHAEDRDEQVRYGAAGPGLSAELADWLRERTAVRAVGVDFVSVSSFLRRLDGRAAHRAFLDPTKPILLIEDMTLRALSGHPSFVTVAPLRVDGADGAPVTVFAEVSA